MVRRFRAKTQQGGGGGGVGVKSPVPAAPRWPHCLGQWAVHLLQCTASLPRGCGQWNSCNALPQCLGEVGTTIPAMQCRTAWRQWAMERLQRAAACALDPGKRSECKIFTKQPMIFVSRLVL